MSGFFGKVVNTDDGYIGTLTVGAIVLAPSPSNPIPGNSLGIYLNAEGTLTVSDPDVGSSVIIIENDLNLRLDGYVDDITFQENKTAQGQINQTILQTLDGYSTFSETTFHENKNAQNQINQSVLQALDGYAVEQTFQENKNSQEEINRQLLASVDGYVSGTGSDGYIAFFTGTDTVAGDNDLYFDRANNRLIVSGFQYTTDAYDGYVLTSDANGVARWNQITPVLFFEAYDVVGGIEISDADWTDITLDTERVKDSIYGHSDGAAAVSIDDAGYFMVLYRLAVDMSGILASATEVQTRIARDSGAGFVEVPGTRGALISANSTQDSGSTSVSTIFKAEIGDEIKVQAMIISGSGTVATLSDGCGLVIAKFTGQQGPKGDPGTGASVAIQDEGSDLVDTPHSTLNFIGPNVSTVNAGSGVANITIGGVTEQTFQENKNAQQQINQSVLQSLDGYASDITVSEHYTQFGQAIQDIISTIDGYATDTELVSLTNTVAENNNSQQQINQSVLQSLDGYALRTIEDQRWIDSSQQLQDLRNGLDGYVVNSTFEENNNAQQQINQTILQALDGYGGGSGVTEQTFQENKTAQEQINQSILQALDGYGGGGGVSEQTFQENKNAQEEINRQLLSSLDGYSSIQGTATQLAYFSGTNTLASDTNLSFDTTNNRLVTYSMQMTGSSPGDGYVLTSDASGIGTWKRPSVGFPSDRIFTVDATHPHADFTTIQEAINHASDGYMIMVSPGSYNEQLTLRAGITLEIIGASDDAGAYTDVNFRTSSDGYLVSSPDAGAGGTIFKNMRFSFIYDGLSGSTALLLMRGPSYAVIFEECSLNAATQSAMGGKMMGVLMYAGTLEFTDCEVVADDNDGIFDVDTIRIGGGNTTLYNTTVYGFNTTDIRVDGGQATLTLESSTIINGMIVGNVQNIFLDKVSRIGSITGTIADVDNETKLTHRLYGVGLTNGTNEFYKLHLRELGTEDVNTPGDGQIWYSKAAGRFRMKEGGTVKDMIPYSTLDAYGGGSGVSEQTFQENKNAQEQINQSIVQALDAYGAASADTILFKSGDQSISSAGFVDISGLTFSVDASSNYLIEAFVIYQSSATTMGVRFAVNGPASPTLTYIASKKMVTTPGTASTDMFSEAALTVYNTPLPASTSEPANNTNLLWEARGTFMNGSNAGTFALRFDKENVAGTATVKAGSFLKYKKL